MVLLKYLFDILLCFQSGTVPGASDGGGGDAGGEDDGAGFGCVGHGSLGAMSIAEGSHEDGLGVESRWE